MPNAWVLFVKEYAKKNNISYGCAISKAGEEYRALKSGKSKKLEPLPPIFKSAKKTETPKPVEKVMELTKPIKVVRKPKLIENPSISKAEKKSILNELTVNLNALKKQQRAMPSQSRLVEIERMEKRLIEVSNM
jgi:hypothetical protein